jgi:aspartate/methionine/tyrosine aminotransferase
MPRLIADRPVLHTVSELGRIMAAARQREQAGERIIHLERGEPTSTPHRTSSKPSRRPRATATRTTPTRRANARCARRWWRSSRARTGSRPHVDDIVVTAGGTHALYLAIQCLMSAGDELLLLSPHWMALPKLVGFAAGARYRALPVYMEAALGAMVAGRSSASRPARGAEARDEGHLLEHARTTPRGAVLSREHLEALASVAIERDLWVLSTRPTSTSCSTARSTSRSPRSRAWPSAP